MSRISLTCAVALFAMAVPVVSGVAAGAVETSAVSRPAEARSAQLAGTDAATDKGHQDSSDDLGWQ
ncbi:hypothetical protein V1J52_25340 [Streptomyces sp. TRM 70351]|uniref:hypothetical protein n=1 Tax=Streptomyces sp. TRM 70351 TaxID=3116552 RepID=UPI002E7BE5EA|nr:hypothetical protein [Streptomyces sp. TRM 70351]MEE1931448.1 hypothetical protein [Streptomyces sp. TRM 70351]